MRDFEEAVRPGFPRIPWHVFFEFLEAFSKVEDIGGENIGVLYLIEKVNAAIVATARDGDAMTGGRSIGSGQPWRGVGSACSVPLVSSHRLQDGLGGVHRDARLSGRGSLCQSSAKDARRGGASAAAAESRQSAVCARLVIQVGCH